jgi:nicotinamide-nucleotide amidase
MNPPRAAILSVGDELVLGTALDTNSRTLSAALRDAGLEVVEHRTVRDELGAIESAMRELAARSDVLVSTGGLGPTDDDLTRPALNAIVDGGAPMVEDPVARADLESWFAGRGRPMASINLRQAMRPRSARIVPGVVPPGAAEGDGADVRIGRPSRGASRGCAHACQAHRAVLRDWRERARGAAR